LVLLRAVSGHVVSQSLRQQLQVIDDRIAFGQEAEAALHAVKNQLLLSSLYIEEIAPERLTPEDREALRIVFESLQHSADVLRKTSASGRAANTPIYADADLIDLARAVVVLAEARAAQQNVRLGFVTTAKEVPVYVDGLLIREVLTNLVRNSLEALEAGGRVDVTVGVRPDGTPFAEVADNGPGLAPEQVDTMFAARVSSKPESGSGIGLTLSHAIATQHGGRLLFVKQRRPGATFRLLLPPRDVARALLGARSKTASEGPRTGQPPPGVALLH
jgi:two-component system, NtrC family, sensor histidine kinase HydH